MNKPFCLIMVFLSLEALPIKAQEFVNGDLSGTITGMSNLPMNWLSIPFNDVNCLANYPTTATPDLTSLTLPEPAFGIIGNPYSGTTFISGDLAKASSTIWHEGIMQTVSGFIIGNSYPINFHQAIVKEITVLDSSGSWAVYIDSTLAGITAPTFSSAPFNSTSFVWEFRTISFVATSVSHTIKFLPMDDDTSWDVSDNAALRMGIDCIYITNGCDSVNTTSIKNNGYEFSCVAYPNPMDNKLIVESNSNELLEIILYDISSRKFLQQKFKKSVSVNTAQFSKGIYIYEVRNKNGVIKKGKVVKE